MAEPLTSKRREQIREFVRISNDVAEMLDHGHRFVPFSRPNAPGAALGFLGELLDEVERLNDVLFESIKDRFHEALNGPRRHEVAVLDDEWGVRYDWADKTIEPYADIPFPSRLEAEMDIALDPAWRTLIWRSVVQPMPTHGEWHPVTEMEIPSHQQTEAGESQP